MSLTFMAVVIGIFLNPALPEDMIKVGDPCEQAMAVVHEQGLTLVDKEYLPTRGVIIDRVQLPAPLARTVGVLSLSYDREGFPGVALSKTHGRSKAGFLLCALALEQDPRSEE